MARYNLIDDENDTQGDADAIRGLIQHAIDTKAFDLDLSRDADVRGQSAWNAERDALRARGATNDPVPHTIDPGNRMTPEEFETAALRGLTGRDEPPVPMSAADFEDPNPRERLQLQRAPITPMSRDEFIDAPTPPPPTPEQYEDVAHRGLSPEAAQQRPSELQGGKIPVPASSLPMNDPQAQEATSTAQSMPLTAPPGVQHGNLAGPVGEPVATKYTPDALRGLTGREPPEGSVPSDAPGVSPWAVLAAAMSRNPGEALASVMHAAAGQRQQWEAQQRQSALDADKRALNQAQIRHLDATGKSSGDWEADKSAREWERIRLAGDAESRRGTAADRALNPQNAATQALVKGLVERSGGKLTAEDFAGMDDKAIGRFAHAINLQLDSANTPQKAADEATIAKSRTNAEQAALIANAPALGAARGVGAAAAEETERPGKVQTTRDTTTARIDAEQPTRQAEKSEEFQRQFAKENDALLRARRVLGNVLSSAPEGGTPEGFDRWSRAKDKIGLGSTNTSKAQLNTQDIIEAATDVIHDRSGAAFTAREGAQNLLTIMGDPLASAEDRQGAVKHFLETVDSDLRGKSVRGKDAQAVVDRVGIPGLDVTTTPQSRGTARRQALDSLLTPKPVSGPGAQDDEDDDFSAFKRPR